MSSVTGPGQGSAVTQPNTASSPTIEYTPGPTLDQVRAGSATLAVGHKGPAVQYVQRALNIVTDGYYGNDMRRAVEAFQKQNGVRATGEVDANTLAALATQSAAPRSGTTSSSSGLSAGLEPPSSAGASLRQPTTADNRLGAPPTPAPGAPQVWEAQLKRDTTTEQLKPDIIAAKSWGAKAPVVSRMRPHSQLPTKITIHHGGMKVKDDADFPRLARSLQRFSIEDKNWGDTPYHYSIDTQGRIYECRSERYAGDTNTNYDPDGHLLIELHGDYRTRELNEAQLEAMAQLSAWMAYRYGIDISAIKGHNDYAATQCPGENIERVLRDESLARRVQQKLDAAQSGD